MSSKYVLRNSRILVANTGIASSKVIIDSELWRLKFTIRRLYFELTIIWSQLTSLFFNMRF